MTNSELTKLIDERIHVFFHGERDKGGYSSDFHAKREQVLRTAAEKAAARETKCKQ